jgi:hypothetical protein
VFSECKDNYSKSILNQCWNYDKINLGLSDFIPNPEVARQVEEFLAGNYKEFKVLYDLMQGEI